MTVTGRRLPDTRYGDLPEGFEPGDYWKYVDDDGVPLSARAHCDGANPASPVHQNLEDTMWGFYSPDGNGIGTLTLHTVREHEDGTISIRPGDGSSNSVLHKGARDVQWHGYVDHGRWEPC